jgi:hypothetical protein
VNKPGHGASPTGKRSACVMLTDRADKRCEVVGNTGEDQPCRRPSTALPAERERGDEGDHGADECRAGEG